MDISFGNAWDWVRDRIPGQDPAGSDVGAGGGILGPLGNAVSPPPANAVTANSEGILPDSGGVNLGQARFDDPQPMGQTYAWSGDNGGSVYIERPDHSLEIRQGGTLTWRDNNPGNLRFAESAIGQNDSRNGPFAIFENPGLGAATQDRVLFGPNYKDLSISDALYKYAPPSDNNNTEAYIADVTNRTGLDRSTILNNFSDAQRAAYADAVRNHEGIKTGNSAMAYYNLFGD